MKINETLPVKTRVPIYFLLSSKSTRLGHMRLIHLLIKSSIEAFDTCCIQNASKWISPIYHWAYDCFTSSMWLPRFYNGLFISCIKALKKLLLKNERYLITSQDVSQGGFSEKYCQVTAGKTEGIIKRKHV